MNTAIVLSKFDGVSVGLSPDALVQRNELIASSSDIVKVTDAFDQGTAVDAAKALNAMLKSVEKTRSELKAPVLDIGRKIDALAKDFCDPVQAESKRLSALVTEFQIAELKRAQEAERIRQAELARIERERIAAERAEAARVAELERIAEAKRQAEEDAHTAFTKKEARDASTREKQAEAERKQQELALAQERNRIAQLQAEQASARSVEVKAPARSSGLVVKEVWKFDVTDLHLLANSRVDLVRIEPNTSAINEAIRGGMRECAGLKIWSETVTGVRS